MRPPSLSNGALAFTLALSAAACGRKGDPVPRPRTEPQRTEARWADLRTLEVTLPVKDTAGSDLVGVEAAQEILARDEVVLEKRRPDLPAPGRALRLDLSAFQRPAGWLVVVSVRVGNVVGRPSDVLPWLDPAF
jgi:hypothetical protein